MRRLFILICAISLITTSAEAATKKASPVPTKKATVKTSKKPTTKATTKSSSNSTSKSTTKATASTTKKATSKTTKKATPKKVYKPRPRRTVKLTPSPPPKWPPKGYSQNGDIYAKIPTNKKELLGFSSASKTVAKQLETCKDFACGAVIAASQSGCTWWEFTSDLIGPTSDTDSTIMKYGSLVSLFGSSKPKQIKAYILISNEDIKIGHKVANIKIACHRDPIPADLKVPSNTYVKNN